jgi:D-aminoacyl-tRNA deacylase
LNLSSDYTGAKPLILVASTQDLASMTMTNYLLEHQSFRSDDNKEFFTSSIHPNVWIYISNKSMLYMEFLDEIFPDAKAFVFLSQHRSQSETKALTCHFPGNFGLNQSGGNFREISIAYPSFQKYYMKRLIAQREMVADYQIVIESSHHGPTSLTKPSLFIEIGSTEIEWTDEKACSIICEAILKVAGCDTIPCDKVAICLGGTHYPTKFTKLLIDSEYGIAAVAAKHDLRLIDKEMLAQMILKSVEKVGTLILDWKGLGKEKERIMALAADAGLEIIRL